MRSICTSFLACVLWINSTGATDLITAPLDISANGQRDFTPTAPTPGLRLCLRSVAGGFRQPIFLTAPKGDKRLFVVERPGCIRVIKGGDVLPEPFLDISTVTECSGECGLLSVAFDPDFKRTHWLYVCYSERDTRATVIARYGVSGDENRADNASRQEIIRIGQPKDRIDHKAGWIGFRTGEPHYLYIATGDGGGQNDPDKNAQSLRSLLGKILRIDVSSGDAGYTIPADNPFIRDGGARPEIWAYGLRNPFRSSFDRFKGDFYIADVGQDAREEINFEIAGSVGGCNYGWPIMEGTKPNPGVNDSRPPNAREPLLDYSHGSMMILRGCVIGGYAYRGTEIPELRGAFFFADFSNARIFSFRHHGDKITEITDWTDQLNPRLEVLPLSGIVSFGEDDDGELYVIDLAGAVYRLTLAEQRATPEPRSPDISPSRSR